MLLCDEAMSRGRTQRRGIYTIIGCGRGLESKWGREKYSSWHGPAARHQLGFDDGRCSLGESTASWMEPSNLAQVKSTRASHFQLSSTQVSQMLLLYCMQTCSSGCSIDGHRAVPARPGGPACRAVPCLPRAAPCRRAGRAVPPPCLVPGVWPKTRPAGCRAGPKARRATVLRSCQTSSRPIFSFFCLELASHIS